MAKLAIVDVVIHVDENLDSAARQRLETDLTSQPGVVSVNANEKTPHLMVVKFDSDHVRSTDLLKVVIGEHLHGELVGL